MEARSAKLDFSLVEEIIHILESEIRNVSARRCVSYNTSCFLFLYLFEFWGWQWLIGAIICNFIAALTEI